MKTLNQAWGTLRRKNFSSYKMLVFCNTLSVLLITAFSVVMESDTVQNRFPPGGDSRTQMMMCFVLAVVGCAMFTAYASSLFFRGKSREVGTLMALGASRKRLRGMLLRDVTLVSLASAGAGLVLGVPLAVVIWQVFRLFFHNEQMRFAFNPKAFIWPVAFALFAVLVLWLMALRFVRRANIMDIINEQRKAEPVRDVKGWYGPVGFGLLVVGIVGVTVLPMVFAYGLGKTMPFFFNALYLAVLAGLYMLLVYFVIRGFGRSRQRYYKNIITRSMMRFQGRQTVRNMLVVALLVAGAYFAMFYSPMMSASMITSISARANDVVLHYRADAANPMSEEEIRAMAGAEGVNVVDWRTAPLLTLAVDGINVDMDDNGEFTRDYFPFLQEITAISASDFTAVTGQQVNVAPGSYLLVRTPEDYDTIWDSNIDATKLHNMSTGEALGTEYAGDVIYEGLYHYYVLADSDFAAIGAGLAPDWREELMVFNTEGEAQADYNFQNALYYAFVARAGDGMAVYENYDRIEKMVMFEAVGEAYPGDYDPDRLVNMAEPDTFEFTSYWKYLPTLSAKDSRDASSGVAVFMMVFVFIAIVCFAAVLVIAYTRSVTIANASAQVFHDLRHLGANNAYLLRQVRGQVSRVYAIPVAVGSIGIFGYWAMLLAVNSGSFEYTQSELLALGICAVMVLALSVVVWLFYRGTLKTVCRMLEIQRA